jgi:hypothetical protein
MSHPGSNWGPKLDFHSPRLFLWGPGPGGLLVLCYVDLSSHYFRGSIFDSD